MKELDFTLEDLEANREGRFTDSQRALLRRALLRDTLIYGLLSLLPLGGIIVLLSGAAEHAPNGVILAILIILSGLLIVYIARQFYATRADLAREVKVAVGEAGLHNLGRGGFGLSIGQQNFLISKSLYAAFAEGKFYRVYYAPRLKRILSAELAEY
ncbi:MAG: hypothetical protein GC204_03370 [Chloroflexi bacterium]|nr:hypothetical protein [Chloroflexota bacterium]